jgi:prepilin-type N-terminal cleavage/methylation domain-containing protein
MKKGFTLVEMLVVIGIIAVLAAAAIGGFAGATKKAQIARGRELVSNVATALSTIYQESGRWPQALVDANGGEHKGELVCNKAIAEDLIYIFRELYKARYPIERMTLIDRFDADDEQSMRDNNSSCFCYRVVKGTAKLSKHAQGLAIDINPLYNPCVRGRRVQPATASRYVNRQRSFNYKIEHGDLLWQLFTERGFRWGGAWRSMKDWQHFEK